MKARKIAQDELTDSIVRHEAQLEIDRLALLKYENECSKGSISTKQFETIMDGASTSAKQYAIETKGAAGSTDVFVSKQKQAQESLKATASASKGAAIAMQALATVGNMFVGWAISEALSLVISSISDYINRLEISKEKLANTESELDSVNSKIKDITSQIKELESIKIPSLTNKEDLERLKAENKELAIRKKYLEDQKKLESEEVVQNAKEKMDYNYGRTTSRESIDAYKNYMDNPELYNSETDTTTIKIAQYEHYQELRKQALEDEDLKSVELLDTKLKQIEESLLADRTELQGFKDDLSLTGESSAELDNVSQKLKFIDNLLLAPSENLKNFLNSDEISKDSAKLKELASSGELTESQFKKSFSNINSYLEENGLSFQDLISVLEIYKDELEGLPNGNQTSDLLGVSDTVTQINSALKPAIDSIAEAYNDIFTEDGFTRENIGLDMFASIQKELDELDIDTSSFDNFISVLEDTESSTEDIKDAFDEVAYAIANSTLSGIEDFDTMKNALKELGYVNFELTAFEALLQNKEALASAGLDLAKATEVELVAFSRQMVSAEYASQAYHMLRYAKEMCNLQSMDTSGEVSNLITLAENAGYTGDVIKYLTELEMIYQEVSKGTLSPNVLNAKLARAEELKGLIEEASGKINFAPEPDEQDWKPVIDAAGKAGKDAGEEYKDALEEELSDLDKVIGFVTDTIDKQIDSWKDQKDAAVDALEEQKKAAEEALQAQIDLVEAQIKAIEDQIELKEKEIEKIQDARKERDLELESQKALYEWNRKLSQNTRLVYKEGNDGVSGQMVYEQDLKGVHDAKENYDRIQEDLKINRIEKEIKILEGEISGLEDIIDGLNEQIEASNKYYDDLISQTEKYFDSMIKNMENYKSRWEELKELQEQAEVIALFEEMGIKTEDILNMSGEAFEQFKQKYLSVLAEMNQDSSFLDALSKVSGVARESFGNITNVAQEELSKMNQLGVDAGQGFVDGWNEKSEELKASTKQTAQDAVDAFAEGQNSHSPSEDYKQLAYDAIDGLLLGVNEKRQEFIDSVKSLAQEGALAFGEAFTSEESGIVNSFDNLKLLISSVAEAIGLGENATIGSLYSALSALSTFSLGEEGTGIISQFQSLKTAVDEVTNAINGGGGMNTEATSGTTTSPARGGEGEQGGGAGGLTGAIKEIGTTTDETMGTGGSESGEGSASSEGGEGEGVLGKFSAFKDSVDAVTKAIGTGEEETGSEEGASTLIGALQLHYEKAEETLPQVKSRFEELLESISACVEKLSELAGAMSSLSVGGGGGGGNSFSLFAKGTDPSASFSGMVGKAFAKGTGRFKGLSKDEPLAITSEYGQPETIIPPDGNAMITTSPTALSLKKGTVILNEEQTRDMLDNGKNATVGKAFSYGSDEFKPIQPGNRLYDMIERFYGVHGKDKMPTPDIDGLDAIKKNTDAMTNSLTNIENNRINSNMSIGDIHIHCSGITSEDVGREAGVKFYEELNRATIGLPNAARQYNTTIRKVY